jgi:hypothetical protein
MITASACANSAVRSTVLDWTIIELLKKSCGSVVIGSESLKVNIPPVVILNE